MEKIKLHVKGNQITMSECPEIITAGTVGLTVEFVFDNQWDRLAKTVLFRAGDKVIAAALDKSTHTVPWEILSKPNLWLSIGVYGADAKGTVVIPTRWMKVAAIYTGVDPNGDTALEPTNPIWRETLARVEAVAPELQNHLRNASGSNPHGVTCAQIGAAEDALVQVAFNTYDGELLEMGNRLVVVEEIAESYDLHLGNKNNPHGVTCDQIGAATQEEVEAQKALVVTVSGSTSSHTSQQIFDAILAGRAVYLKMWSGTYMALSWATADEIVFEASQITSVIAADGKSYGAQNFRLYRIFGDRYYSGSGKMVSQEYVDAQIAYYLNQ